MGDLLYTLRALPIMAVGKPHDCMPYVYMGTKLTRLAINSLPGVDKIRSVIVDLLDEIGSPGPNGVPGTTKEHRQKQRVARSYLRRSSHDDSGSHG